MGWTTGLAAARHSRGSAVKSTIHSIQHQAFQLIQAEQLWAALHSVLSPIWLLIVLVLLSLYGHLVLSLFPWTRPLAERLLAPLINPLRTMGEGLLSAIPDVVFIAILVVITPYVLKLMRLFFTSIAEGTVTLAGFERTWALPAHRLVRLLVIVFAVVVAYPYIPGSSTEAFKGVTIFLGVIFSLGSSSVIANVIAGYTMTYRRAFRIGDRIKIGDHLISHAVDTGSPLIAAVLRRLRPHVFPVNVDKCVPKSIPPHNCVTAFRNVSTVIRPSCETVA
jgi:small-conductance mechanosensitive channel